MKKLILLYILLNIAFSPSLAQEKKMIRKAAIAVDRSDFEQAIWYYDQVLKRDEASFYGNAGKGVVLSEYMEKHEEAIPFLEKALNDSPEKNKMKLNYDLGKCNHRIGNYNRALYFYGRAQSFNKVDHPDYDVYLSKRIADCKYALNHTEIAPPALQSIKNLGYPINSEFPEYSPVFVKDAMIFTAQKKDDKKERKNGVDGRYFESMYVSKYENGAFSEPERFTVPDLGKNSKFIKFNEAVLSASSDGKQIFIYRNGQIYEANPADFAKAEKLDKNINFSALQSHASLSPDGNTLFFASEAQKGVGAIDLYKSTRQGDGKWSTPELLPFNTEYNEDAPFMAEDGTLYFASNGLPGYGGYDIYKTKLVNGRWAAPENLGQPINSPGDEIYFSLLPNSSIGYYSSSRADGKGDMDIYELHYISTDIPECTSDKDPLLAIETQVNPENNLAYSFEAQVPQKYTADQNYNSYTWKINNELASTMRKFDYLFTKAGSYTLSAKAVLSCDSCPQLIALCNETVFSVGVEILAKADSSQIPTFPIYPASPLVHKPTITIPYTLPNGKKAPSSRALSNYVALSEDALNALKWNKKPVSFELNDFEIQDELKAAIDKNIEILKQNAQLKIAVNGYTDARGSSAYNMALSKKRANSVKNYMIKNGISAARITVHPFGESILLNNCTDLVVCTEEEHAENRRVDFILYKRTDIDITAN
jgi:outer membrane protein OmpA-like peptidoglycan-associated protein